MYPQTHQKPARGAGSRRTEKTPKRNTPTPEARTRNTETSEQVEKMAKDIEQTTPLTITLPDFVRYEVRTGLAEGFAAMRKENAEIFGSMQAENAERFDKITTKSAERFGEMKAENAEWFGAIKASMTKEIGDKIESQRSWIVGTAIGAGILITGIIALIINWPW